MMKLRHLAVACSAMLVVVTMSYGVRAEIITIDTVHVGYVNNAADDTGFGSVDHEYWIGKYEVTNSQYAAFLNAVDPSGKNTLDLYSNYMASSPQGGIELQTTMPVGSRYVVKDGMSNKPVVYVNFYDAARFVNWLHNGQGNGGTETGSYDLSQGTAALARLADATWVIPSENEWYKAAYYDPNLNGGLGGYWDFPTRSNSDPYSDQPPGSDAPDSSNTANFFKDDKLPNGYDDGYAVGGPVFLTDVGAYANADSAFGTFDQGGNVWEWIEEPSPFYSDGSHRGLRGGSWYGILHPGVDDMAASHRAFIKATYDSATYGFRVATLSPVPEPTSLAMLFGLFGIGSMACWRRNKTPGKSEII